MFVLPDLLGGCGCVLLKICRPSIVLSSVWVSCRLLTGKEYLSVESSSDAVFSGVVGTSSEQSHDVDVGFIDESVKVASDELSSSS